MEQESWLMVKTLKGQCFTIYIDMESTIGQAKTEIRRRIGIS